MLGDYKPICTAELLGHTFEAIKQYDGDVCWIVRKDGRRVDSFLSQEAAEDYVYARFVDGPF